MNLNLFIYFFYLIILYPNLKKKILIIELNSNQEKLINQFKKIKYLLIL